MEDRELALRFAVALGLGLFVGLERERRKAADTGFAGVRTFGLIGVTGALSAYLQTQLGAPWMLPAAFLALATLVAVSYWITAPRGDVGITTEVAALVTFLLGALCFLGMLSLAASLAVVTALVLSLRDRLHDLARRLDATDVEATLKFAIIALIVLPLVPDRNFGPPPLDVVNPYKIWWMVVLISGVDFASYVLVKIVGPEHGPGITGLLGGLVSSTALTLGFARRSREDAALCTPLALGIVLAWSVMFVRVLVLAAVMAPDTASRLAIGLGVPALAALVLAGILWRRNRTTPRTRVESGRNPFELVQALKFGAIFGVVVVVAKAAQVHLGTRGLYAAGAVAGLTDVDAISLSMLDLARSDPGQSAVAARTIEIAVLANTAFKGGMALALGSSALRRSLVPAVIVLIGACAVGVFLG